MTGGRRDDVHGAPYTLLWTAVSDPVPKMEGMRKADYVTVNEGFIDSGWKDTVLVMPGEEIEIIKPFQNYSGLFLYHCHTWE